MSALFDTVLVANRGEIALRVMRTCRRLGIRTIAVYSDADARAQFVQRADLALRLGAAEAKDSYLSIDKILAAAQASGAQAIHPGYGFLSENDDLAAACEAAGIAWVGPPASAMRAMGDKSSSKTTMAKAGVPVVPGYHGADQADATFVRAAAKMGAPVLVKASSGGGGKGMRRVDRLEDLPAALASARREAKSAFGDDTLLLEKFVEMPRHVEIQVFADAHGHAVHLFERECSLQRRYQKVLEEAPSPSIDEARRRAMGEAAVRAALAVGYRGAGTVEFIVAPDGSFYFLEMNTRLQVEHPVTEMITGLDLVEWQLRVAAGEPLPLAQDAVVRRGHAVEVRLCAEDSRKDDLPATGTLAHLAWPAEVDGLRVDTGFAQGDVVSIYYDSLLAKLIAWAPTRGEALTRLARALGETRVVGVATNVELLAAIVAHPEVRAGRFDTGFLARERAVLLPPVPLAPLHALGAAALHVLLSERRRATAAEPSNPWATIGPWRVGSAHARAVVFDDAGTHREVTSTHVDGNRFRFTVDGVTVEGEGELASDGVELGFALDGTRGRAWVVEQPHGERVVHVAGARYRLRHHDPLAVEAADATAGAGRLVAPMPAKVVQVRVREGDRVEAAAVLVVLEAMKMEMAITAPAKGTVGAVHFAAGDQVREGATLVDFEPEAT